VLPKLLNVLVSAMTAVFESEGSLGPGKGPEKRARARDSILEAVSRAGLPVDPNVPGYERLVVVILDLVNALVGFLNYFGALGRRQS